MTDSNYTHILAIVDRSGSMSWNNADKTMTKALNEYFKSQAEVEGKCLVDFVEFDTEYNLVYSDVEVGAAEAFIRPRGGTALLDAIGRGTVDLGRKLKALPEAHRPAKVQVVIVTDGAENSSRQYSDDQVKKMITDQESKYDWDYVFLGANIDAVSTGARFGVAPEKALTFNINDIGATTSTMASMSTYTTNYRGGTKKGFTEEDRLAAVGK